jgi:uncharacterized protein (TIGR03437 family)
MNAAGQAPIGLPGAAIARGALITIAGEGLGPGRVTVTITDARGSAHVVTPLFAAGGQIHAVLPCAVAPGDARLAVTVDGRSSLPSDPFPVVSQNFQIFTRNQRGFGPAIAENLEAEGFRLNSLVAPAARAQVVALWGTGLGVCDAPAPLLVWIGGQPAVVLARRPATDLPGVEQIFVLVPWRITEGCFVPVVVQSGREYSNFASLAVGAPPAACSDKVNGFTVDLPRLAERPLNWARLQLLRGAAITERPGIVVLQTTSEQGEAGFVRSTLDQLNDSGHYPALGSCLVRPMGATGRAGAALDAGALMLSGPWDLAMVPDREDGIYRRRLAPTPFDNRSGDFLRPDTRYTVVGSGGRDVGRFEATVRLPAFLRWINRDHLPFAIHRTDPFWFKWSGADPLREFVVIRGFSFDRALNRGREFVCSVPAEAGLFQLPEAVIWSLPNTQQDLFVSVGNVPLLAGSDFQAAGIDVGFFRYEMASGRNFSLQ